MLHAAIEHRNPYGREFNHRTRDRHGGHGPHLLPWTWDYWGPGGARFNKRLRSRKLRRKGKEDTLVRLNEHFLDLQLDFMESWFDENWNDYEPEWDEDPADVDFNQDYYDRDDNWDDSYAYDLWYDNYSCI